jgi:hypothetical protein
VGDRDQGYVMVPAANAAALEVVKPQAAFEFAIIVLNPPSRMHL